MNKKSGNCYYCGEHYDRLTRDHVLPQSKGGKGLHNNIVMCCSRCNGYKADFLLSDFILYLVHVEPAYYESRNLIDTVISNCLGLLYTPKVKTKKFKKKSVVPKTAPFPAGKYAHYESKLKVIAKIDLPKPKKVSTEPFKVKLKRRKKYLKSAIYVSENNFHRTQRDGKLYIGLFGIECNPFNFHCE